uniref:Uncharacterized protein n=1 Tax=Panagrolaimus sp. PS1159 TaxID=55785 RepID=A0AC35FKK1_9BILA
MNQMQTLLSDSTSEWSINLVTPLQNLFHHASRNSIIPRVEAACRFHDTFMSCIGTCEETFAREAVLNGQESWISICHAFRTDDEFINFILPCWAEHGDQLSKKCHIHALMVQNSVVDLMQNQLRDIQNNLADLCRTITIYDKCYIWQTNEYCGEKGWRFLLKLNQRSSMALIKLLTDSALIDTLPPTL